MWQADSKGRVLRDPMNGLIVQLDVINRAIELIVAGQIHHYWYDIRLQKIIAV